MRGKTPLFVVLSLIAAMMGIGSPASATPGDLDTSFSHDGLVINHHFEAGLAVQTDGKVLFLDDDFTVLRYTTAGKLDPTFAGDGSAHADFAKSGQRSGAIALQPDGRIVVAGGVDDGSATGHTALARFLPDGSLDPSFSHDGLVIKGGATGVDPTVIAIDGAGHLILGSFKTVMEFNGDGTVNRGFGSNGIASPTLPGTNGNIASVGVQASGKIIVGGSTSISCCATEMIAGRLTALGQVDPSFGDNGFRLIAVHPYSSGASSLVVAPNGTITLGGVSCNSDEFNSCDHAVARLSAGGTIKATGHIDPFGPFIRGLTGLALQGSKTLAVGGTNDGTSSHWCVERYRANLTFDPTFGSEGFICTSFGGTDESAAHVAVDGGGRIIVSGRSGIQGSLGGIAAYLST